MATVIKELRLINVGVDVNMNRWWTGRVYDNGDFEAVWGRVGNSGQSKLFPGGGETKLEEMRRDKIKKGYSELKTVGGPASSVVSESKHMGNSELRQIAKAQLLKTQNPVLDRLVDRLIQANVHRITTSTQIQFNSSTGLFSTPLGIVTPDGITEARNLLVTLNHCVSLRDWASYKMSSAVNQYLRIVPQNVGMKLSVEALFPDDGAIQKQSNILDSLESSYQALQSQPVTTNATAKSVEQVFKVDFDVLNDQKEIDRIVRWFNTSNKAIHGYSNVRIMTFLKIKIHDNWNSFNEKTGNIKEIWHGSSEANLLSILKTGLKVSPPSTTTLTGKMFGEGHYGALDSSKSMQYTFGRFSGQHGSSGWLFIADFAMGNTYFINSYGGNKPVGYDSIWAKAANTGLRFDELIVPRDNQVRLKYLIEVK